MTPRNGNIRCLTTCPTVNLACFLSMTFDLAGRPRGERP
jgi:hypothetical protein